MKVRSKVWFQENGKLLFGDGKSKILKAIAEYHSINKAAVSLGMSFRRAWSYIGEIEKRMGSKMIERSKGGKGGGGSCLTPLAKLLIEGYDDLKEDVDKYADKKARRIIAKWKDMRSSGSSLKRKSG